MIGRYRARKNYQGGGEGGPEGEPDLMGVEYNLPCAEYEADFSLVNSTGLSINDLALGQYEAFPVTRAARIESWNTKPWQLIVNGTWGNQSVPTYILWEHNIEVSGGAASGDSNKWGAALSPTSDDTMNVYTTEAGFIYRATLGVNIFLLNGHQDGLMATFTDTSGTVDSNKAVIAQEMDITQFTDMGVARPPAPSDWTERRPGLLFLGEDPDHWAPAPASYLRGTITAYSAYPATFEKVGELE